MNQNSQPEIENSETNHEAEPAKLRRAPMAIGGRNIMIKAIKENAQLIAETGGHPLLTARQVLDALKNQKLLPPLAIAEMRSANGIGDVLGFKHLDLPFMLRGTKRSYLIQAAAWTPEEKREFDDKPADEQLAVVEQLIADFAPLHNA